jgi:hypothetical protein
MARVGGGATRGVRSGGDLLPVARVAGRRLRRGTVACMTLRAAAAAVAAGRVSASGATPARGSVLLMPCSRATTAPVVVMTTLPGRTSIVRFRSSRGVLPVIHAGMIGV